MNKPPFNRPGMRRPSPRRIPPKNAPKQPNNNWIFWLILGFIFVMLISQNEPMTSMGKHEELSYNAFYRILEGKDKSHHIKKLKLIEMVIEEGIPINQARKQLSIKYPSAKSIIQRYRASGRLYNRDHLD